MAVHRNRVIYQSEALFISPDSTGAHFTGAAIADAATPADYASQAASVGPGPFALFTPPTAANQVFGGTSASPAKNNAGNLVGWQQGDAWPAWNDEQAGSSKYHGTIINQLKRVQTANYGFTVNRQDVNQFGHLARLDSIVVESPTVNLDFSYYLLDGYNERQLEFVTDGITNALSGALSPELYQAGNNYFILTVPEARDAVNGDTNLHEAGKEEQKTVISLGNGYITDYSVDISVGSIPTASVTVEGMNIKSDFGATGNDVPGIDMRDGSYISSAWNKGGTTAGVQASVTVGLSDTVTANQAGAAGNAISLNFTNVQGQPAPALAITSVVGNVINISYDGGDNDPVWSDLQGLIVADAAASALVTLGVVNDDAINDSIGGLPGGAPVIVPLAGGQDGVAVDGRVPKGADGCTGLYSLPAAESGFTGCGDVAALRPGDIVVDLQNAGLISKQVSGDANNPLIGSAHVQSVSFSVPMGRTTLQRLGSTFGFSKALDVPITVTMSVSAMLSEIKEGNMADLLCSCEKLNVGVKMFDPECVDCTTKDEALAMIYTLKGARLESENFTSTIGDNKTVDLTFSATIGGGDDRDNGLFISGKEASDAAIHGFPPSWTGLNGEENTPAEGLYMGYRK